VLALFVDAAQTARADSTAEQYQVTFSVTAQTLPEGLKLFITGNQKLNIPSGCGRSASGVRCCSCMAWSSTGSTRAKSAWHSR